ncbi:hypothetical protein D3C80_2118290 [compost metagenome]
MLDREQLPFIQGIAGMHEQHPVNPVEISVTGVGINLSALQRQQCALPLPFQHRQAQGSLQLIPAVILAEHPDS